MSSLGAGEPGLASVVIPVYNGADYLAEAVESVLAQYYRPLEVVAIDDGSTDGSAEILARYPQVKVITQPNGGCTVARNRGIAATRGEYVAFIDQDDRWRPGKLQLQLSALRARPDAGYALGRLMLFVEPGCPVPAWMGSRGWTLESSRVGYMPGTMVVRRAAFDELGTFDERFVIGSDADWLVRARDAGMPVVIVHEVVLDKRLHRSNLSGHPDGSSDMLAILAASLRRRGQSTRSS
jgi:glycosyltransferase involved in cell wall biosynthesis